MPTYGYRVQCREYASRDKPGRPSCVQPARATNLAPANHDHGLLLLLLGGSSRTGVGCIHSCSQAVGQSSIGWMNICVSHGWRRGRFVCAVSRTWHKAPPPPLHSTRRGHLHSEGVRNGRAVLLCPLAGDEVSAVTRLDAWERVIVILAYEASKLKDVTALTMDSVQVVHAT